MGGDGGTSATTLETRWGAERYTLAAHLPFATYVTPDGRHVSLGNLGLEGWYLHPLNGYLMGIGVEAHLNVGHGAWSWVNSAEELWPGYGGNVVWQMRTLRDDGTNLMYRASLGFHGASGFEPFPKTFLLFNAAFAVDQRIIDRLGFVGEASFSYWDVSPLEVATMFRGDILPGFRARVGVIFPLAVWAGWCPADQPAGMREATLVFDLSMSR